MPDSPSDGLPPEISIHEEVRPTLYQADCDRCGWHTRQAEAKWWVERMALLHKEHCPDPHYENGAEMECGCWWRATPGSAVGETEEECPTHGRTLVAKANVECPESWTRAWWVCRA